MPIHQSLNANAVVEDQAHLENEAWTGSSFSAVVLAFLKAEWNKWPLLAEHGDRRLITEPDITDARQNDARLSLLRQVRRRLLDHVPANTQWFEVRHLEVRHFWALRNIHQFEWSRFSGTNELLDMVRVRPEPLRGAPDGWQPILWAHEHIGPFTILEGNHRLAALANAPAQHQSIRLAAYVGLSPSPCGWHRPDGVW
jgi:hypothetical protein